MEDDLPSAYDVIIAGTGMVESIVAAACARIEKKVLHLDNNSFYGHLWATFSLDGLEQWTKACLNPEDPKIAIPEGSAEKYVVSQNEKKSVSNLFYQWFIPKDVEEIEGGEALWSQTKLKSMNRKFNIDLAPKLLFSKGPMVELLLQSRVSRYTEFVSIAQILTYLDNKVERVPCSKSDVFSAKHISIVDKRLIMRVLEKCLAYTEGAEPNQFADFSEKTFLEYLQYEKIPDHLISYILYSVAMSERTTLCLEAVKRVQKFVHNFGFYGGKSPFLWPLYGSAELLQAYCRLSAVFGGIYYLTRGVDAFILDGENGVKGVLSSGRELQASHVVTSAASSPREFIDWEKSRNGQISRAILITDKPIMACEKETASLLYFPPEEEVAEPVTIIELGPSSGACPKGLFVVHLSTSMRESPIADFEPVISALFRHDEPDTTPDPLRDNLLSKLSTDHYQNYSNSLKNPSTDPERPRILFSYYFSLADTSSLDPSVDCPSTVHLCSGPNTHPDFDGSISQAREIFHRMFPDQEFLAPVPEPAELPPDQAEGDPEE